MNGYEPVVKANRDFVGFVSFAFDPISRVVEKLPEFRLNTIACDSKIAFRRSVVSGLAPDPAEHPAMQAAQECFVEHIALATERPSIRFENVLLFEFVEFAMQGDVCR